MALNALPRNLNETYDRMIERIPPERKHKAIRLLQFLVYSDEPLTVQEAVDLIAVRVNGGEGSYNPEDRMPDPSEVIGFCPSLVSLVPTQRQDYLRGGFVLQLHLAHFSVKEYLLRHSPPGFRNAEAEIGIAETCMAYLSSVPIQYPQNEAGFPFMRRATSMFEKTAVKYETSCEKAAVATLLFLKAGNLPLFSYAYSGWAVFTGVQSEQALYQACTIGLVRTTMTLVSEGSSVHGSVSYLRHESPIGAASVKGHVEIVDFLLRRGASAYTHHSPYPPHYQRALIMASASGQTQVAQLLIDNGADVNWQGKVDSDFTALQAASSRGYQGIVQLLLERGADVNLVDDEHKTPLHIASLKGHRETVQLLLEGGADVNAASAVHGTPLQLASICGHLEVVRLLLEKGADVNLASPGLDTPLQAVVSLSRDKIVDNILGATAHLNTVFPRSNMLHIASSRGYYKIVELLLDWGANVNEECVSYEATCRAGGEMGSEYFWGTGVSDFFTDAQDHATALNFALDFGQDDTAQLLLDNGAKEKGGPKEKRRKLHLLG